MPRWDAVRGDKAVQAGRRRPRAERPWLDGEGASPQRAAANRRAGVGVPSAALRLVGRLGLCSGSGGVCETL